MKLSDILLMKLKLYASTLSKPKWVRVGNIVYNKRNDIQGEVKNISNVGIIFLKNSLKPLWTEDCVLVDK